MKRVWVDVTLLMLWPLSGIQRVIAGYIERLHADNELDDKYFVLKSFSFEEISYDEVSAYINKSKDARSSMQNKVSSLEVRNNFIKNVLHKTRWNVNHVLRTAIHKLRISGIVRIDNSIFKKGDMLLLMDGNWSDGGVFVSQMIRLKKEKNIRIVHLIHDIVAIKNSAFAARDAGKTIARYFRSILPFTDTIVCISKSTSSDVEAFLNSENIKHDNKIRVVENGSDINTGLKAARPEGIHRNERFIMFVSTIEVRKNHHLLYYVYKKAFESGINLPKLVIVGRPGWMVEETIYLFQNDSDLKGRFVFIGASDAELEWLYQNCLFTVFPSFYEGWGLPIAESLNHGKLCISSNTSSMMEIGQKIIPHISPYSTDEWLGKIQHYCSKAELAKIEKKIEKEYQFYSWDDAYDHLKSILLETVVIV